ncbi:MAG: AraC family transcriptional regulator [Erysipelotrichaceae bacterium]|nr:AraC family transcriptional regulator [Erysipelotrichaceae bacterium]
MNYTEYKHELIIPNESIPVKIFDFAAHNDLRVIPYHWHNSAEILYVRRGKLNIWMNKKNYVLKQNDFIYINSKEVHSTQSPEDNEVIVLQIPGNFLETFSNNQSLYIHCNTIEIEENKYFDQIRKILYQMYICSQIKDDAFYLKVYSLLFELGYILVKNFWIKEEHANINTYKYLNKLSEICEYIKSHYQENLTLNEVAGIYGYSPQYLSRIFKKYTGTTFLAYLNTIRLNMAYKQITQTDYSILTIAEDNGFSNVKALNKLFKETYGVTPTAYHKQIKK